MQGHFARCSLLAILFVPTVPALGASQELSGFVRDSSGGAVPGATITATQRATDLARTVVTNDRGYYVIRELPLGEYEIAAELTGFTRVVRQGVILRLDSRVV